MSASAESYAAIVKTKMPRILIADDQPEVLTALRLLLKGENYDISPASSPAAVVKIVERQELDLVLIDLNIPDLDGFVSEDMPGGVIQEIMGDFMGRVDDPVFIVADEIV